MNELHIGDLVLVHWLDGVSEATVVSRDHPRGGEPSRYYRVEIAGVKGHPFYEAGEMKLITASATAALPPPESALSSSSPEKRLS